MSELKESSSPASAEAAVTATSTTEKSRPVAKPNLAEASDGSLLSHFLFFLGTSLFALPMLVPGVSMGWLAIVYGSMFMALTLFFVVWGLVGRLRDRREKR